MRLFLYNPNSNEALTAALTDAVAARLSPEDRLTAGTADSDSPGFIGSEATIAAARDGLDAALPSGAGESDAVLLGCFGDLGVGALRRMLARPVVSLSDACFAAAPLLPARLAIVTTSPFWVERLGADIAQRGLAAQIVAVTAVEAAPDRPDMLPTACQAAIAKLAEAGRADAVVLGGAVLEALRSEIAQTSPLPIVDNLALAIGLCRSLAVWAG